MSHLTDVYSIVPRLPPAIDDVGDYTLNLARQLRKDFIIQTHFIVGNLKWKVIYELKGFSNLIKCKIIQQICNDQNLTLFGLIVNL